MRCIFSDLTAAAYLFPTCDRILIAQFACIALAFRWPRSRASPLSQLRLTLPKASQHLFQYSIALVSLLSLLVTLYRTPSVLPRPHRPGYRIVRTGIWTVHFGMDNEGRDSQRLMRDLVRYVELRPECSDILYAERLWLPRDMELDVVGLLETDLHVSSALAVFGTRVDTFMSDLAGGVWQPRHVRSSYACTFQETYS